MLYRIGSVVCIFWLVSMSACQTPSPQYRVMESSFMEFDDLSTPTDTIRFDASVPFGTLGSVDLSDQGEFLVMDFPVGPVHVFTASGRHVRTTDISQCSSERTGILWSARFLKSGGVVVVTSRGVYLLNADGSCNQRLSRIPPRHPSFWYSRTVPDQAEQPRCYVHREVT